MNFPLFLLTFITAFTFANPAGNDVTLQRQQANKNSSIENPCQYTYADTSVVDSTLHLGERVFQKVEVEATFDGDWMDFLSSNLKANVPVKCKAPAGKYLVVVQFIVDKDGSISQVTPLTAFGYGMEEEVMRVIKKSPKWNPAMQNGRPVKAYRKQPITFVVSEKK